MDNNTNNNNIQNFIIESIFHKTDYRDIINASHPYPCGICQKNVNQNQKGIMCSVCKHWVHIKCNGTSVEYYNDMIENNALLTDAEIEASLWNCNKCELTNRAMIFPFGFADDNELLEILNADNLNILYKLPSYEISSKVDSIATLKHADIDENVVSNINSRYYPRHEFAKIKTKESFNIIHSNVNGLESKFEDYNK